MDISGKWIATAKTPFGPETYFLDLRHDAECRASHERGEVPFDGIVAGEDGSFSARIPVKIPMTTDVWLTGALTDESNMAGVIQIGEFALCEFTAVRE